MSKMLNPTLYRRLYFEGDVFYCLKDVLIYLQNYLDSDSFLRFLDRVELHHTPTLETLQKKYPTHSFHSYLKEYLNQPLINDFIKKKKTSYRFVSKKYISSLLTEIRARPNYLLKHKSVINCLKEVFQNESYRVYYTLFDYEVEFYLEKYKLVIQPESTYSKYKKEKEIERLVPCKFIRYRPGDKHFDLCVLLRHIFNHIISYKEG